MGCHLISTTVPPTTVDVSALATSSALATVDTVVDAIKVVTDALPGACSDVIAKISQHHSSLNTIAPGIETASIAGGAGVYVEALNVSVPGYLWWASACRGSSFASGTLNMRVTIDGNVAALSADATVGTTSGTGVVVVGYISNSTAMLMPIRFNTSLKLEVISSVAQSGGGDMYANYIYTVS